MEAELLQIIADTLTLPVTALNRESSSDNTEKWDSLAHMNIIFAVEDHFGVQISDEDLPESMSVEKLLAILQKAC